MAKKIFIYIAVIIACGFLFVFGSFLFMFLAPGAELFGIRYVAVGQGEYELSKEKQIMPAFTGDIYIESKEIPIKVTFESIYNITMQFRQEFVGFTRSENKYPYIEYEVKNNNLHIKSFELEEFLYNADSGDGRKSYLNLYLPITYQSRGIYIKSNNSVVKIDATACRNLSVLDVETSNEIFVYGSLSVNKLIVSTRKPIDIGKNLNANHIKLTAGTNNVTINKDITGTLEVDAGSSTIFMGKVNNFIFKSSGGSIKPVEDKKVIINKANIETKSGNINIDEITGAEESIIKTLSGSVNIGSAQNLNLTNERGPIEINSVGSAVITGGVGTVDVGSVSGKISVTTKNGNVTLGDVETVINNPKVETNTGKIHVVNCAGTVNLISKNNLVDITSKGASKVKIVAGRSVKAHGITGELDVEANGDVDLQVENLGGNIKVKTDDGCKNFKLDINKYVLNDFNYHFKSTKGRMINIYSGTKLLTEGKSEEKRSPYIAGLKTITIETSYSDINVYTK